MATDTAALPDLEPGDRVRCYSAFSGTVVRVIAMADPYVIVRYDHDQGQPAVYPPYVQRTT